MSKSTFIDYYEAHGHNADELSKIWHSHRTSTKGREVKKAIGDKTVYISPEVAGDGEEEKKKASKSKKEKVEKTEPIHIDDALAEEEEEEETDDTDRFSDDEEEQEEEIEEKPIKKSKEKPKVKVKEKPKTVPVKKEKVKVESETKVPSVKINKILEDDTLSKSEKARQIYQAGETSVSAIAKMIGAHYSQVSGAIAKIK